VERNRKILGAKNLRRVYGKAGQVMNTGHLMIHQSVIASENKMLKKSEITDFFLFMNEPHKKKPYF
jgi:hypothetical protein